MGETKGGAVVGACIYENSGKGEEKRVLGTRLLKGTAHARV